MTKDPTAIPITADPAHQRMSGRTVHGNLYFDVPYITEITPNLYQGGCTTGLILPRNIDHLVSLYPWERYEISHELKSELYVQEYDSDSHGPSWHRVGQLAQWVNHCRRTGTVLVHCQAGLNRSALVVAIALIEDAPFGEIVDPDDIIALLRNRSPAVLCNPAFEAMVRGW